MLEVLNSNDDVVIHAVNFVETNYYFLRRGATASAVRHQLDAADVEIVHEIGDEVIEIASILKAHHTPIALGDVLAVALASTHGLTLLTADRHELAKSAAADFCAIEFIR